MLRFSARRCMKPYLHAFSPGARASEKGMLYRNSNMNAHARVASIQQAQRTHKEGKIFLLLLAPDQVIFSAFLMCTGIFVAVLYYRQQPFSFSTHKQRWILGAMNEHEFYQRNDEMGRIFELHREAIENTRAEVTQPVVFTTPEKVYRQRRAFPCAELCMWNSTTPCVVLDVGSNFTKVGFSKEEAPRSVFRSVIGVPRHQGTRATLLHHPADVLAGDEAFRERGLLQLRHPVRQGHVVDLEAMEHFVFHALYHELKVVPDNSPLLFLEPADERRKVREDLAELFFESFNVPSLGMLNTSSATVYSTGRTTGVAVDSGAGKTMINAVYDGYPLSHVKQPSYIAGDALTDELMRVLREQGYPLSTAADRDTVERIKETMCRVSLDADADVQLVQTKGAKGEEPYSLPDNERIYLFESRFMVPEILFQPDLLRSVQAQTLRASTPTGYTSSNPVCERPLAGWVQVIERVIADAPGYLQDELYSSIVLGGGTTLLADVEKRLQRELVQIRKKVSAASANSVSCVAFPERGHAAWTGGSVWASSAAFPHSCVPLAEYHESGPNIVHRYAY